MWSFKTKQTKQIECQIVFQIQEYLLSTNKPFFLMLEIVMQFLDTILASHNWVQLKDIENACSANRKQSKKKIQIKHP